MGTETAADLVVSDIADMLGCGLPVRKKRQDNYQMARCGYVEFRGLVAGVRGAPSQPW